MLAQFIWAPFPFLRYTLIYALGILVSFSCRHIDIPLPYLVYAFFMVCTLFIIVYTVFSYEKTLGASFPAFFGYLSVLIIFLSGFIRYNAEWRKNVICTNFIAGTTIKQFVGQVSDGPVPGPSSSRYLLNLLYINDQDAGWQTVDAGILVYFPVGHNHLDAGDVILVHGNPDVIQSSSNPSSFDYKSFMAAKGVYLRHFTQEKLMVKLDSNTLNPLIHFSKKCRDYIKSIINKLIIAKREKSLIIPLLTGYKSLIPKDLKKSYGESGAMHILAVSGLHVGILYLMIIFCLGWLRRIKYGEWVFLILCLLLLWFYALITGLPASVVRATIMFSLFAVAKTWRFEANAYNNIAIAAFIILMFQPMALFEVGFQLSFAAIIGIIFWQPKLASLWLPDHLLTKKIWSLTTVSIAAQWTTFPFAIFYFHQFPIYFWLSNLIVIPAAFIIISIGALLVFLYAFNLPLALIANLLSQFAFLINESIETITLLPYHVIKNIYISPLQLVMLVFLIVSCGYFVHQKRFAGIVMIISCLLLFFGTKIIRQVNGFQQAKIVFYDIKNSCAVDMIAADHHDFFLLFNQNANPENIHYATINFRIENGLPPVNLENFPQSQFEDKKRGYQFMTVAGKSILFLNKPMCFDQNNRGKILINYLVINNQAIKNFDEINRHFKFDQLIVSNLNGFKYTTLLTTFSVDYDWQIHNISTDGALIINLPD